tara:strand:- start:289 stop:1596 length:1308 start_codon:yes stop_codon:yes gene_type:complete
VQNNPFNNLPIINKKDAINILSKPLGEVKFLSDYYKAVFHLASFPCEESETALLDFIKSDYQKLEFNIARRKAIEVLALFDCKKAIPTIADYLQSDDSYLVESSLWSLGKLKCNNDDIINKICSILYKKFNNKRLVIQTLTILGVKKEIEKIRLLYKDQDSSIGVKGASLAALVRLSGENEKLIELKDFLRLSNQNDRHCAVQDIVNSGHISLIPFLIKAPISPSFKIKAIDSLWITESLGNNNLDLINSLDSVIIDDPSNINIIKINNYRTDLKFLMGQLFHTDFNRCYRSMQELQKYRSEEVLHYLNLNWDKAKADYGAIYFFINAYKFLLEKGFYDKSLLQKVDYLLSDSWPDYMKFKSSAIEVLASLNRNRFNNDFHQFSDEIKTPYWKNRYTALLVLQRNQLDKSNNCAKLFLNDSHRFVRLKAKQISKL